MGSFREYLYGWLVEQEFIREDGETTVEDLSVEYICGETDCTEDMLEDAWYEYSEACDNCGETPVNDVDGFTEPY